MAIIVSYICGVRLILSPHQGCRNWTCPIGQCTWESQDLEAEFAGALTTSLQAHLTHAHPIDVATKPEKPAET